MDLEKKRLVGQNPEEEKKHPRKRKSKRGGKSLTHTESARMHGGVASAGRQTKMDWCSTTEKTSGAKQRGPGLASEHKTPRKRGSKKKKKGTKRVKSSKCE